MNTQTAPYFTESELLLIHASLSIATDNAKIFYTACPGLQARSDINALENTLLKVTDLITEPSRCAGVAPLLDQRPVQAIASRSGSNLYDVFTCRTANILKVNGITTVEALLGADLKQLFSAPAMMPTAIADIKHYFKQIEAVA